MNISKYFDLFKGNGTTKYSVDRDVSLFYKYQFSTAARLKLYRKISTFLNNNRPINEIVNKLSTLYSTKMPRDIRVNVLRDVQYHLMQGRDFSNAISAWIPNGETMLIRSGEHSSSETAFRKSFENLVLATEGKQKLYGAIMSSMAQPIILISLLISVVSAGSVSIIPKMAAISDPSGWTALPKSVYIFSMSLKNYWLLYVASLVGLVTAIIYSIPRYVGEIRDYLDFIPPWSIYKKTESAAFLISAGAMLKSGIPLNNTIQQLATNASDYVRFYLDKMLSNIRRGGSSGQALDVGFFDVETTIDVEVYSESTNIGDIIDILGKNTIDSTIKQVEAIARGLNIATLLLVGTAIAILFLSIFEITDPSSLGIK